MSENARLPIGWLVRLCQIGALEIFLGIWELAGRLSWVNPEILPPFSKVAATPFIFIQNGDIFNDLKVTAIEVASAFLLAVPLGVLPWDSLFERMIEFIGSLF